MEFDMRVPHSNELINELRCHSWKTKSTESVTNIGYYRHNKLINFFRLCMRKSISQMLAVGLKHNKKVNAICNRNFPWKHLQIAKCRMSSFSFLSLLDHCDKIAEESTYAHSKYWCFLIEIENVEMSIFSILSQNFSLESKSS